MSSLGRDSRGVAMVFGIFFAMFMVAVVYAIHGTIEALVYREHVQDAADAAAFSAAVVNARGMNLIVLLNMLMAALLAILVGLRIGQTVCLIGVGICIALAYPTMGASLAYEPVFQGYAKMFKTMFDKLKPSIHQAISIAHAAGKATSVAVPLGANLRVIDLIAARYDAVGLAIPSRLTLPVEDDDFPVLCGHAGELAGYVVMLPLAPVIPNRIEDALASGLSKLAAAGSKWFCGEGGKPPDMNPSGGERDGFERLPKLPSQELCESMPIGEPKSAENEAKKKQCKLASYETMLSQPARDGTMRNGERVCPTDCKTQPRASCPPEDFDDCDEEEAAEFDEVAREQLAAGRVSHEVDNPYVQRQRLAIEQCRPEAEGGSNRDLRAFEWLEQQVTRTYVFNRQKSAFIEDESVRRFGDVAYVRKKANDKSYPCGKGGIIAESYEAHNSRFLCEGRPVCEEDTLFPGQVPGECGRPPIPPKGYTRFRETKTRVVKLVGCSRPLPKQRHQTPPVDLNKEMENSGDTKSTSKAVSFRLEKDLYLGGSDFQLRSVVVATTGPSNSTEDVVRLSSWGKVAENQTPQALVDAANVGARLGFAQAEYYFDWSGIEDGEEPGEWLWNMCWRARMRPFRMNHSSSDGPREKDERGFDDEQKSFGGEGLTDGPAEKPVCQGKDYCGKVESGMSFVSSWENPQ